jgi:hypothetical protein
VTVPYSSGRYASGTLGDLLHLGGRSAHGDKVGISSQGYECSSQEGRLQAALISDYCIKFRLDKVDTCLYPPQSSDRLDKVTS